MRVSPKRGLALAAACLAMLARSGIAQADLMAYVTTSGGDFGTLDLDSGVYASIGSVGSPGTIFGMGYGADGQLYGLDSRGNSHLYRIDTATGAGTDLGAIGRSAVGAGADDHGTLFALSDTSNSLLYSLNPPATAATAFGRVGFAGGGLVAYNEPGQLFVDDDTPGNSTLYRVDPTTGAATTIGAMGVTIYTGAFFNGTLYGLDDLNTIWTIDTTTGRANALRDTTLDRDFFYGAIAPIKPASVPEPSSLVMLALGGVVLAVHRGVRLRDGRIAHAASAVPSPSSALI